MTTMSTFPRLPAIGGYFGIEPEGASTDRPAFLTGEGFQSARSALAALAVSTRMRRILVPRYICPVVLDALRWADVEVDFYHLQPDFLPPATLEVAPGDRLLVLSSFGLGARSLREALSRFPAASLIVDAAQSLFFSPPAGVATIYSPRKYVGVADGGFLAGTDQPVSEDYETDAQTEARLRAAVGRSRSEPEPFYPLYLQAEASLHDVRPRRMSVTTRQMLDKIEWNGLVAQRRANFQLLRSLIAPARPVADLAPEDVPLCLPVRVGNAHQWREQLASQRIYTQCYWQDLDPAVLSPFERSLVEDTIYLPCDQRYGAPEMQRIAEAFWKLKALWG